MSEKKENILALIILIILVILMIVFKIIPEVKQNLGSSDKYIKLSNDNYKIELNINNLDIMLLTDKNNKINNILFMNDLSYILYNKNIENKYIYDGLEEIINILLENNIITNNTKIILTRYDQENYDIIKQDILSLLFKRNISVNINEYEKTLSKRLEELNMEVESDDIGNIKLLELYSKNIIRKYKNNINYKEENIDNNETISKIYADNIYNKLDIYINTNNIKDKSINDYTFPIYIIPADKDGVIYADKSSRYYIKDYKVYAYIKLNINNKYYDYCYNGTINDVKRGEC